MTSRRGFQIVEAPHASSGSVCLRLPLLGENQSMPVSQDRRRRCITLRQRERAPPGTDEGCREPRDC
jgi:hypothetical protein